MKRNRIIAVALAAVLTLSGCACENSKDKKDEKVVQKKKEKKRRILRLRKQEKLGLIDQKMTDVLKQIPIEIQKF